jgi:membrane protein DedA with SNARE-associated domain
MARLVHYVIVYGVPLIMLNVFLEQIGLPVPAVPTLIIAGALARDGKISSTHVLLGAVVASLAADWIWFLLGRHYGFAILRTLCKISLSPDSCVRETAAKFERWGLKSLLFAKFIPGFSTVAPPLAGAAKERTWAFAIYDGLGALIWAGAAVALGRLFHRAIGRVLLALENLGGWAVLFVALVVGLWILVKWWQRLGFYKRLRMARIHAHELKAMLDRGEAPIVLDVRTPTVRKLDPRRIPGAIVAQSDAIDTHIEQLPPGREIVLYCT